MKNQEMVVVVTAVELFLIRANKVPHLVRLFIGLYQELPLVPQNRAEKV
jgi:hypothetical protein